MNISEEDLRISRLSPARIALKGKKLLTKSGSTKKTYHLVLDIHKSGIHFKVGDSLGIYPENDPLLVQHLLDALKADPETPIMAPRSQEPMRLREFLTTKANLSRLTASFLKLFYAHSAPTSEKNALEALLQAENRQQLSHYLSTHDPLDLLKEYKNTQVPLQELCEQFSPLLPRFYSVASSQKVHPDEVHLTVALFTYDHNGEMRYGVGSHFLCELAQPEITPIFAYVQPAPHFTLPEDGSAPIIMVGPGTGIAAFRAFLQERVARGALGKNWLFFGERNRTTDYFYQEELENLVSQGRLRLDLAFSRDQEQKVYVQHRMQERAKELWSWLEEGAYFYVCGDAKHMAKDVERTLLEIIAQQANVSEEEARAYIKALRTSKRYLADVY